MDLILLSNSFQHHTRTRAAKPRSVDEEAAKRFLTPSRRKLGAIRHGKRQARMHVRQTFKEADQP